MSENKIVVPPNLRNAVIAIDQLTMARDMDVVKNHHICYGTDVPLCGVVLEGKGLIKDKKLITCPTCRNKMYK